jgi:hypothetical protein
MPIVSVAEVIWERSVVHMTNSRLGLRGVAARRTAIPPRRVDRGAATGFAGLLSKLGMASAQLQRARPRRRGY